MQELLINVSAHEVRVAHLKNGTLVNLFIERLRSPQLSGNIYKGCVSNILANIQSAFVEIGEMGNGFIHISDIVENTKKLEQSFDLDVHGFSTDTTQPQHIQELLSKNQTVLVQVIKEAIGSKGARLTSNISLPGRYLVLLPNTSHRGVSRKIDDWERRTQLKKLLRRLDLPASMGVICRTASRFATDEAIVDEAQSLIEQWYAIIAQFNRSDKPTLLYQENDLIKRSIIMAIDERFDRVLIDDQPTLQASQQLSSRYTHEHPLKMELYRDRCPIFERFNVEREIDKALSRKIWLSNGGYLYFDRTEAMYTIDVNSGRSTQESDANLEEAIVQINIEAAREISRQLRLRNIGGLVICDFIDMQQRKSRRRVLEALKEAMRDDWARCTVLEMSDFGLVEMTRQRIRESLETLMLQPCPYCQGMGLIRNEETTCLAIERGIRKAITVHQVYALDVIVHPQILQFIHTHFETLYDYAKKNNAVVTFVADPSLHLSHFEVVCSTNKRRLDL